MTGTTSGKNRDDVVNTPIVGKFKDFSRRIKKQAEK